MDHRSPVTTEQACCPPTSRCLKHTNSPEPTPEPPEKQVVFDSPQVTVALSADWVFHLSSLGQANSKLDPETSSTNCRGFSHLPASLAAQRRRERT